MHPILLTNVRLGLYFLLWFGLSSLFSLVTSVLFETEFLDAWICAAPPIVVLGLLNLSPYYLCRANPIRSKSVSQTILTFSVAGFLTTAAWVYASEAWYWWVGGALEFPYPLPMALWYAAFGAGLLMYGLAVISYYLYMTFEKAMEYERTMLESKIHAMDAELKSLRAQIDPHFLFNSLHSISALTTKDPKLAREMIIKLSDFFRTSLSFSGEKKIPLSRELGLIELYLELERIRFGDRLRVEKQVTEFAMQSLVPPLILQPLVENALKHGVAGQVSGGVIRLRVLDNETILAITVENTVDASVEARDGLGVGLKNVSERLRLLYGDEAVFRAGRSDEGYFVHFQIPSERV